jgi:hypothetical protein
MTFILFQLCDTFAGVEWAILERSGCFRAAEGTPDEKWTVGGEGLLAIESSGQAQFGWAGMHIERGFG